MRAQASAQTGPSATFSLITDREPVTVLGGPWRFQPGDDPRYADPAFDDSQWKLIRSDRSWAEQGYKNLTGYAWYRFRIVLPAGKETYSLLLPPIRTVYQCFVDGKLLRTTGIFPPPPNRVFRAAIVVIPLPVGERAQPQTLQVAIRVWHSPIWANYVQGGVQSTGDTSPIARVGGTREIEGLFSLGLAAQRHYTTADLDFAALDVLAALIAIALYLFRRAEREYLWFAIVCLTDAVYPATTYLKINTLWDYTIPDTVYNVSSAIGRIATMALFNTLLRGRWNSMLRLAVGCTLLNLAIFFPGEYLNLISIGANNALYLLLVLPFFLWMILLLVRRLRDGFFDAKLLVVPIVLGFGLSVLNMVDQIATTSGHPLNLRADRLLLIYPFSIQTHHLAGSLFLIAMLAILINRFARTSRDQERVASEMEAARSLQQVLIPETLPEIPGLVISAAYHPAQEVGGDFFQIVPLPSGDTLIVLGDVSGKGLPAAMTVSLAVGAMRTMVEFTESPAKILAGLNRRLCGRGTGFTTCLALRFSPTGTMIVANAGHLAPYLNGLELETEPALPLGLAFDAEFTETLVQLALEDHLTLLTDGIPEATCKQELFGFVRTENLSQQSAHYIADAARSFGQTDDITVLTIDVSAVAAPEILFQPA